MYAHVSAPSTNIFFERRLFRGVEHNAGCRHENHRLELRQVGLRESRGVLGGGDREVAGGTETLDRSDALGNGRVAKTSGLGEDEHLERGVGGTSWNCAHMAQWNRRQRAHANGSNQRADRRRKPRDETIECFSKNHERRSGTLSPISTPGPLSSAALASRGA